MKTIPTKQINEKQVTIHQSELGEETYPFAILEASEVNEEGQTESIFEPILGNNRFSEVNFKTKEETIDYIKSKPYDLILALICHCIEMKDNFEKEQQNLKNLRKNENEK